MNRFAFCLFAFSAWYTLSVGDKVFGAQEWRPVDSRVDNGPTVESLDRSLVITALVSGHQVIVINATVAFVPSGPDSSRSTDLVLVEVLSEGKKVYETGFVRHDPRILENVGIIFPVFRQITLSIPLRGTIPPIDELRIKDSGFVLWNFDFKKAELDFCQKSKDDEWCRAAGF